MFRTAELGRSVPKQEYREREPVLREELLLQQQELRRCGRFPVIVYLAGVEGAGKDIAVNRLNEWMDPRWISTRAYGEPADVERERPEFWRYWLGLPPRGTMGLFMSAWYHSPVLARVYGKMTQAQFDNRLDRINAFEKALADDGALILKFWMHLSREAQKRRLKSLEKNPLTSWRATEQDWKHWHMYDEFITAAERVIMRTSTGHGSWTIVEGLDDKYASLTIGATLRDALGKRLEDARRQQELEDRLAATSAVAGLESPAPAAESRVETGPPVTVLSKLDMTKALGKTEYSKQLKRYQARLGQLHRQAVEEGVSSVLVFEGADAAGKGGAIRRLIASVNARNYQVLPFAAPTDEERAHHYLWRFWRHVSRAGRLTIFDRSWYGRVLVERVEGFATQDEWRRAYAEINDFEEQLIDHGIVVMKYWLHITQNEQLSRFEAREKIPYKRWKLTEEDWRNREKWDEYQIAINDMVQHTSTHIAPWILVEGNDKRYARIKVIKELCRKLEERLVPAGS